jgi:hypothetical protein
METALGWRRALSVFAMSFLVSAAYAEQDPYNGRADSPIPSPPNSGSVERMERIEIPKVSIPKIDIPEIPDISPVTPQPKNSPKGGSNIVISNGPGNRIITINNSFNVRMGGNSVLDKCPPLTKPIPLEGKDVDTGEVTVITDPVTDQFRVVLTGVKFRLGQTWGPRTTAELFEISRGNARKGTGPLGGRFGVASNNDGFADPKKSTNEGIKKMSAIIGDPEWMKGFKDRYTASYPLMTSIQRVWNVIQYSTTHLERQVNLVEMDGETTQLAARIEDGKLVYLHFEVPVKRLHLPLMEFFPIYLPTGEARQETFCVASAEEVFLKPRYEKVKN